MGNWDVKPDTGGERELLDRAVKALETEFATKTCNKQITSKLEDAELARDSEETCNNKQVISKLVASKDTISRRAVLKYINRILNQGMGKKKSFEFIQKYVEKLPPVTPKYTNAEIQKIQELEQAQLEKAYELGKTETQPCGDCISRQAAIEEIRFGQSFITKIHPTGEIEHLFDKENKALETAVKRIEALPSVTPKQRAEWIPVSERLTKKNMECLVAVGEFNITQMAMYSDLMGIINHRIFYQGDYGNDNFENITQYVNAWMPLPKPYKAESEEQNNE